MNKIHTNWYKKAVIYQIYPRSFYDTNSDGLGDIKGIISKLDYLKELGVNCVWLSPVYDSPQKDNGYDISNYLDIYPPFGNMDDFKEMLKGMHDRGIRLIMDLVVNHTSDQYVWFEKAIKDKNSPYRDYYIIRKGKKNGKKPPNNWQGFFGEGAWSRIGETDEWYLHLFTKEQPDLNWENPKVREEVKNLLKFWLDLGVDGFRCDVINLISKKQDFKSRFPHLALTGKDAYINGPRLHEYLHELYRDVFSKYDCMTVGETVLASKQDNIDLTDPAREELDMIFNFSHTNVDNFLGVKYFYRKFRLSRFKNRLNEQQINLKEKGWNSLFIENHDQRRSVGRFGTVEEDINSSKSLATAYFLLKGTPFIYQGQEIGMRNAHFKSIDETEDIESKNIFALSHKIPFIGRPIRNIILDVSRDNARTPMLWDDSIYGGFSDVSPWIRVNPDKDIVNVKKNLEDKDSIYYFYKKLIEFRKENETIINGEFRLLEKHNPHLFAYVREDKQYKIIVMSSFSKKEIKSRLTKSLKDEDIVISNFEVHKEKLQPFETRVYKIKK